MTAPNTPTEPTVTATPEAARQTSIYSRILWISVGAILVLALAALLAWRLRPPELHGVLIQSPQEAADFTLMTSTGEPMSLSDSAASSSCSTSATPSVRTFARRRSTTSRA